MCNKGQVMNVNCSVQTLNKDLMDTGHFYYCLLLQEIYIKEIFLHLIKKFMAKYNLFINNNMV